MNLTNFGIAQDNIAIEYGEAYLDLHNCFDFRGLKYEVDDRTVFLNWTKGDGDWVPETYPKEICIRIDGVQVFRARERDAGMPFTEDHCMNFIGFMWDSMVEEMGAFASHRPQENCTHLSLEFMSGLALKVSGDSATLMVHKTGAS